MIELIKKIDTTGYEFKIENDFYLVQWEIQRPGRHEFLVKIFKYKPSELSKWHGKSEWHQISDNHTLLNHAQPTQFASVGFLKKQLNITE